MALLLSVAVSAENVRSCDAQSVSPAIQMVFTACNPRAFNKLLGRNLERWHYLGLV